MNIIEIDDYITKKLFKKYTAANLVRGEKIKFQTTKHWINFFNKNLFWFTGASWLFQDKALMILSFFLNLVLLYITIKTDECIVTNKKVVFKTGFIRTNSIEMSLSKIESLMVDQSLLGKILGYGTVHIVGTGGTVETYLKINKPLEIKKKIQEVSFI